jgi:hypothetical protein
MLLTMMGLTTIEETSIKKSNEGFFNFPTTVEMQVAEIQAMTIELRNEMVARPTFTWGAAMFSKEYPNDHMANYTFYCMAGATQWAQAKCVGSDYWDQFAIFENKRVGLWTYEWRCLTFMYCCPEEFIEE